LCSSLGFYDKIHAAQFASWTLDHETCRYRKNQAHSRYICVTKLFSDLLKKVLADTVYDCSYRILWNCKAPIKMCAGNTPLL